MFYCVACINPIPQDEERLWQINCGHAFCSACIEALIRSSLSSGPFPPRCCGHHIEFNEVNLARLQLPEDLSAKLKEKLEEFNTSDRTYCSIQTCSSFIGPSHTSGNNATCPVCQHVTCVACKAAAHTGECPDAAADPALEQLFDTAFTEGWRRCGKCQSMIDRIDGCNAMLCTCGHEFCYECGEVVCVCESDDEDGLLPNCLQCGMPSANCSCDIG